MENAQKDYIANQNQLEASIHESEKKQIKTSALIEPYSLQLSYSP